MYLFLIDQKDSSTIDFQAMSEQVAAKTDLVQCVSAETLLNVAEKLQPDIIAVDFDLLDHEALVFFRTLRKKCPQGHILALTNPDNFQDLHVIIEQGGIDDYVFKPLKLKEFLARIHIVTSRKSFSKAEPVDREAEHEDLAAAKDIPAETEKAAAEPKLAEDIHGDEKEFAEEYAEGANNLFEENLLQDYDEKGEDLFESPQTGGYAGDPDVAFNIGQETVPESAGLLLDEDLERVINKDPVIQNEGGSVPEEEFSGFFEEEPFQESEKPSAEGKDLFSDIIGGEADHDSEWDFVDSPEEEKVKPVTRLDKLPEPFDAEFPQADDHEMDDFTPQPFSEPIPDVMPVPPDVADQSSGIPRPPDLEELKKIHRKPPGSSSPHPPEELFEAREEKKTSFDQVFTDRVEGYPQQPAAGQDETVSTVDEFESFFAEEEGQDFNSFGQQEKGEHPPSSEPPPFLEPWEDEKKTDDKPKGKAINTVLNVLFSLLLVFIALISFFLIQAQLSDDPPGIAGHKVYIYMNDSMKPELAAGSLVLVQDIAAADVKPGDVITFPGETDPDAIKASRVVQINAEEGLSFVTRADASSANDPNPVPAGSVIGKVTRTVPYLGYLLDYAQTREGVIMLVFIPGLLIIVYQLVKIFRHISFKGRNEAAY